jgi:hypothetical protein
MDNTGYRAAMAQLLDTLDLIWVQGTSAQRAEALGGLLLAASNLPESIGDAGARRPAVTPRVRQAILGDEQAAARQDALQRQQQAGLTDEDRRAIQAETRKLARRYTMVINDSMAEDWQEKLTAVTREQADLGARLDGGALRAAVRQAVALAVAEGMDRRLIRATIADSLREQLPEGTTR